MRKKLKKLTKRPKAMKKILSMIMTLSYPIKFNITKFNKFHK